VSRQNGFGLEPQTASPLNGRVMAIFQGLLLVLFGLGLLFVDCRSLSRGWLPCGSNGFKGRLKFYRAERPVGYWVMFLVYGLAGLALLVFGIRLLIGHAEPLPLR
jgi:hypothetical protein